MQVEAPSMKRIIVPFYSILAIGGIVLMVLDKPAGVYVLAASCIVWIMS
jgi:hypothetical protein